MRLLQTILLAALPLASALAAETQEQLRAIPDESIRAALEKTLGSKYRDGVFEHSEHAIEALDNEDPDLVSKVFQAARQEQGRLMRRQANVTTTVTQTAVATASQFVTLTVEPGTTTTTDPTTTAPASTRTSTSSTVNPSSLVAFYPTVHVESSQPFLILPTQVVSTNPGGSTIVVPGSITADRLTTNVVVPVTTTDSQGQSVTTSTTIPILIIPTVNAAGSGSVALAIMSPSSTTPAGPLTSLRTTTDANGRYTVITYTPGGGVLVKTTVLPNGQQSTITTFVQAPGATGATSTTPTAAPTLPGGGAAGRKPLEIAAVLGAALGMAAIL